MADLDDATWALAAVIATYRDAAQGSLAGALSDDLDRTAVLTAIGLVTRADAGMIPHPALPDGPVAGSAAAAWLTSLRQAADCAAGDVPGWAAQPDEVLLAQGHASAESGHH